MDQVLIDGPGFLLGGHVLVQVGDGVRRWPDVGRRPGHPGGVTRIYGLVVLRKVGPQAGRPELIHRHALDQLVDHGGHDFPVGQFFCADVGQKPFSVVY